MKNNDRLKFYRARVTYQNTVEVLVFAESSVEARRKLKDEKVFQLEIWDNLPLNQGKVKITINSFEKQSQEHLQKLVDSGKINKEDISES